MPEIPPDDFDEALSDLTPEQRKKVDARLKEVDDNVVRLDPAKRRSKKPPPPPPGGWPDWLSATCAATTAAGSALISPTS